MESTTQAEQPVKSANISGLYAMEYVAAQNSVIIAALGDEKNYVIATELTLKARYHLITAYLVTDYTCVIGMGQTTMQAVAAFRADLDYKRKELPRKLREDAARKIEEAQALESQAGVEA